MTDDTSSSLRLVAAPTIEPLTLAQAKTFLRIEHNADDEAITRAISAVRVAAEQYLRLAVLAQTWDYHIANPSCSRVSLTFGPVQSITSVTLTNEAGETALMDVANYRLSVDGFAVLFDAPLSTAKLTVRYVAGMAVTLPEIPALIVQGMLHHIAVMLENRDGVVPLPMQAIACYEPFRRISL